MTGPGESLKRVQAEMKAHGLGVEIETFPAGTRTARDAARAVGCEVAQIAKSLVFRSVDSGDPVLIVTSGANRVDLERVAAQTGAELVIADADFVRERTGYAVGGVPPIGHRGGLQTYLDRDLLGFERIWAAAGRPDSVFSVSPQELLKITGGTVIDVK